MSGAPWRVYRQASNGRWVVARALGLGIYWPVGNRPTWAGAMRLLGVQLRLRQQ